jgi:eukaryotic-like serine/threonine-protein kinase
MTASRPNNEAIFHAARDIPDPDRRREYVREACGGDEARIAHVEALLAAADAPDSLLDRPAGGNPVATTDQPTPESPGTVIGPYKLIQEIGEGGMGSVWMAQQTEPVKRLVAVKLIKAGMDSKQVLARFEAERQALALMDHAHIARVLDGGTTGAGRPYFVMDLVKGVPITRYCDEHHLTPRQRLELFVSVCSAIQHAHQKGIIHRDLKPSNVLVARYDGKPVVKVIDFGVAKAAGQPLTEKTLVTGFGAIVGTLEYMSPEQAEINQLDIDTRSDVYSLGVLLYELLTGSPPFSRNESENGGMLEMLRVIREQEPTRPSAKLSTAEGLPTLAANRGMEPAKLTKLVRGELDWIVMKALEKDRSRRYETANGFAMDVQRYLADEPVAACPPSAWYRFRKFARRNKGRVAVVAGVFLAVLVMMASIGWALGDRAARQAEVERRAREGFEAARTLIAENKLIAAREKLAAVRAQLGNSPSGLARLAAEIEAAEAELDRLQRFQDLIDLAHQAETAPVLEPLLAAGGSPGRAAKPPPPETRWGWRPAAAVPFRLKALDCYAVLEGDDWSTALEGGLFSRDQVEQVRRTVYDELLWLADDLGDRQQEHRSGQQLSQEAAARAALVYLAKAERAHQPTQALYVLRARCRTALGEEAAAQADQQRADQTLPTLAVDHYLRGVAAYQANQLAEGIQAFEEALHLEPTHYWSLMWLGYCLCDLGRGPEDFAGAARAFIGCILKRPDHAHAYRCRGLSYDKLGQYDRAVADYSRAIDLDPKFADALYNRGVDYCARLGQPADAVADFSRAIDLDPKLTDAWNSRGAVYCDHLGQYDKAVADFSRAIDLDPKSANAWHNRGVAYDGLGRYDQSVADYSRAIDLDPKLANAWNGRGVAYSNLSQYDQAVADYSRAIDLDPKFADAWYNRGNTYSKLGQHDRAVADYSRAIDLDPKGVSAWYNRGNAYSRLGQHDQAVADYSRAIDLNPKSAKAWNNRSVAYLNLKKPDDALADCAKAIELDPKLADAWYNRGEACRQLGLWEKAADAYRTAIGLKTLPTPGIPLAHRNLAEALNQQGKTEEARQQYENLVELDEKAVERAPNDVWAWRQLGWDRYRAGGWKDSIEALEKSCQLQQGGTGDCGQWIVLALAHAQLAAQDSLPERERMQHRAEARRWYERAVRQIDTVDHGQDPTWQAIRAFRAEADKRIGPKDKNE